MSNLSQVRYSTMSLDIGLQDRVVLKNKSDIPKQEIRMIYPNGQSASFATDANRNMKFYLPTDENLVIIGEQIGIQMDVELTVTGGTAMTGSGAALPNDIMSIFNKYKVRVGNEAVHDISNFGLLKRKLKDLMCTVDYAASTGSIQENYVPDPDMANVDGVSTLIPGSGGNGGFDGFATLAQNSKYKKRYFELLIPHGFLARHLPTGRTNGGGLPQIEIELELNDNAKALVGFDYPTGTPATAAKITVSNPKLVVPCYINKEIHNELLAGFSGYYNDFQDFSGASIPASSNTHTVQYALAKRSISGLILVPRVKNNIELLSHGQTANDAKTNPRVLDKMGQTNNLGLKSWYYRYNGKQIPNSEVLEANQGVMPYVLMRRFKDEYLGNSATNYYYQDGSQYFVNFSNGGQDPTSNLWFPVDGNGAPDSSKLCRFNLYHSFRADSALLYGVDTSNNSNTLEVVLQGINTPNAIIQIDTFIRYDSYYWFDGKGFNVRS